MPFSNSNGRGNLGLGFSALFSEHPQFFLKFHASPLDTPNFRYYTKLRNTPFFMLFEVIFRMTDFMKWLYPRYIRPYVEAAPQEEYEMWLSLMESDLEYQFREEFDKTLEFTAIHVFLLGLRTGAGLGALIPQGTAPSAPGPSACTPP